MTDIKKKDEESLQRYLTRFNVADDLFQKPYEELVHMEFFGGVNKKTELLRDLTKQKKTNL